MNKRKYFTGAIPFFLLDTRRPEVEHGIYTCPDIEDRMRFTETLNEIVFRISTSYDKIILILEVLGSVNQILSDPY